MDLTVAGGQLPITKDIRQNAQAIRRAFDFAGENAADILLTPEGSLSGYTPEFDTGQAEDALAEVTLYAKEAGVGLALGTCFVEKDGKCYNQLRFYERDGTISRIPRKILLCGDHQDPPKGEINHNKRMPQVEWARKDRSLARARPHLPPGWWTLTRMWWLSGGAGRGRVAHAVGGRHSRGYGGGWTCLFVDAPQRHQRSSRRA